MVRVWLWILKQSIVVVAAVMAYFGVRGLTDESADVAVQNAMAIVDLEKQLGIYVEKGMQDSVAASDAMATLANWVYIWGHWPVIAVTMVWTASLHRQVFIRLRDAMVVSGVLGMALFLSFPVAPPRLAGLGFVDTVSERSSSYRVLQPPAFVDQYAAMPSLHVGWDLLVGVALLSAASSVLLRVIGVAMPVVMVVAVVVTANHYVLDAAVGIVLALVGHAVALRLERRGSTAAETAGEAPLRERR